MSAFDPKRTSSRQAPMSALPPKADIGTQSSNVRFVPKADMWRCINSANSRELTLGGNEMTNSSTSHTISPEHIMQIGLGFWASKTLLSAVEMELFTHLSKRPGTVETLQGQLGLHPRSARDFLDALVALGFLERKSQSYKARARTAGCFILHPCFANRLGGVSGGKDTHG